jgi:ABC-type multidrug transport system permease subunit
MRQRPSRDWLLTVAMLLFAIGLLALAVVFGLFATGHRDLPMWLSLSSLLLPLGLALGIPRTLRVLRRRSERSGGQPAD